ncbi:MAG: hypothetical protein ACYTER_01795 [Planctomycetota bacterium]|jgi:hypothetical protein
MAKKITDKKLVQDFKAIADFQLPKETMQRDLADLREQLSKGSKSESPAKRNVWSTSECSSCRARNSVRLNY